VKRPIPCLLASGPDGSYVSIWFTNKGDLLPGREERSNGNTVEGHSGPLGLDGVSSWPVIACSRCVFSMLVYREQLGQHWASSLGCGFGVAGISC